MKGLLYKDCALLIKSYKSNFLLVLCVYLGMAVFFHMDFLCYALVAVCGVYASATISLDDSSHWDAYARTLPVTPGQLIGCKYLLGFFITLLGGVCAILGLLLSNSGAVVPEAAFGIATAAAIALLLFAVDTPLAYQFGAVRARSWVYVIAFVAIFIPMIILEQLPETLRTALTSPLQSLANGIDAHPAVLLLPCIGALLLYLVSWAVCVRIYQRKSC